MSDNAPGFSSLLYKAIWNAFGTKTSYGLPYECKSTAKAERTNKRLNQGLRVALVGKDPKQWDSLVDYVCSAMNALKNRTTGFSGNRLRYGREVNSPLSLLACDAECDIDTSATNTHAQRAYQLHKAYRKVLRTVAQHLNATYERDDASHNRRVDKPFKAGDLCLVMIRCPHHKFAPRFHGPVKIIKAINESVYVIDLEGTEKVVNISKLKRFKGQNNKYCKLSTDSDPPASPRVVSQEDDVDPVHQWGHEIHIEATVNRRGKRKALPRNPAESDHPVPAESANLDVEDADPPLPDMEHAASDSDHGADNPPADDIDPDASNPPDSAANLPTPTRNLITCGHDQGVSAPPRRSVRQKRVTEKLQVVPSQARY